LVLAELTPASVAEHRLLFIWPFSKDACREKFCTLAVKAIPNAPRHEIVGWLGDTLKVKIHAPPVEGRANAALCEFIAEVLDVPRRNVTVLHGDTSRQKLVRITRLSFEELRAKLNA
jgi:uncharacterized protein